MLASKLLQEGVPVAVLARAAAPGGPLRAALEWAAAAEAELAASAEAKP
jgi:hypothetical protein